jgi:hypothetical protein
MNLMSSFNQESVTAVKAINTKCSRLSLWGLVFIVGALMFAGIPNARAAFVTTNETGLDGVFSQPSFGSTPVDIRFSPIESINASELLKINDPTALSTLFALNNSMPSNVVSIYFVDEINYCGGSFNTFIVGCGSINGNDIVVESSSATGAFGIKLLGHELGHNLGLGHVAGSNLMSNLDNSTLLTASQVASFLGSALLQMDGSSQYIEIRPVLVAPLPPAVLMFVSALLVLFGVYRKKSAMA